MYEHKIHGLGLVRQSSSISLTHKMFSFVLQVMYLFRWMQGPRILSARHLSSIVFHGRWKDRGTVGSGNGLSLTLGCVT